MEPISIMLLAAVITKMISTHREELEYAKHGKESPRYKMKQARYEAALKAGREGVRPPARPGAEGFIGDLWDDCWEDLGEYRRRRRDARKADAQNQRDGQEQESLRQWSKRSLNRRQDGTPVDTSAIDDMVDLAGVRPAPATPLREGTPEQSGWNIPGVPDRDDAGCNICGLGRDEPWCEHRKAAFENMQHAVRGALNAEKNPPSDDAPDKCNRCPYGRIVGTRPWPGAQGSSAAADQLCNRCGWLSYHLSGKTRDQHLADLDARRPATDMTPPREHVGIPAQHPATDTPDSDLTPDNVIPLFPITKETDMANAEITGLPTAISFAQGMAAAHRAASTAGGEQYVAALRKFEVGDGTIATVGTAQELSAQAAAAWEKVAAEMSKQNVVTEAYQAAPDAGNKQFVTGE